MPVNKNQETDNLHPLELHWCSLYSHRINKNGITYNAVSYAEFLKG